MKYVRFIIATASMVAGSVLIDDTKLYFGTMFMIVGWLLLVEEGK